MPNVGLPSDPYALAKLAAAAILARFQIAQLDTAFVLGSGWSAAAADDRTLAPNGHGGLLNCAFGTPRWGARRLTHGISCRQARLYRGRGD